MTNFVGRYSLFYYLFSDRMKKLILKCDFKTLDCTLDRVKVGYANPNLTGWLSELYKDWDNNWRLLRPHVFNSSQFEKFRINLELKMHVVSTTKPADGKVS